MPSDQETTPPPESPDTVEPQESPTENADRKPKNLEEWLIALQKEFGSLKGARVEIRLLPKKD